MRQWFIQRIDTFAPPAFAAARQQLYQTLQALRSPQESVASNAVDLFVLAQIVAAQQLTVPASASPGRERRDAHATWYAKERQRMAKLLGQIAESPVVASFHATVHYYPAEEITCPHGRNLKTCEALYALGFTLQLLERHPVHGIVRKQVERLRRREPHLPALHELCVPQGLALPQAVDADLPPPALPAAGPPPAPDELTIYLLGTIVSRLRHAGLTIAQSCTIVDCALSYCFGRPDPTGARPAVLAEQWRRLG
jgi:hypothetical protein